MAHVEHEKRETYVHRAHRPSVIALSSRARTALSDTSIVDDWVSDLSVRPKAYRDQMPTAKIH